ncbi:MAG: hypothetical protein PHQ40_12515 [Anaerolineaceae bacterium]|nr:hypothetical protein [Anaerolineaceae bacterium]
MIPQNHFPLRVSLREALQGSDGIEHVDGIAGIAVRPGWIPFRPGVAVVVDAEDDISGACQPIHVGDVALGRAVLLGGM